MGSTRECTPCTPEYTFGALSLAGPSKGKDGVLDAFSVVARTSSRMTLIFDHILGHSVPHKRFLLRRKGPRASSPTQSFSHILTSRGSDVARRCLRADGFRKSCQGTVWLIIPYRCFFLQRRGRSTAVAPNRVCRLADILAGR
jgi:hypothetical protein